MYRIWDKIWIGFKWYSSFLLLFAEIKLDWVYYDFVKVAQIRFWWEFRTGVESLFERIMV